jgi:hypothetical protein
MIFRQKKPKARQMARGEREKKERGDEKQREREKEKQDSVFVARVSNNELVHTTHT